MSTTTDSSSDDDDESYNVSDSNDAPSCEVRGCFEDCYYYTPCCHVPLCDDHKYLVNTIVCKKCQTEEKVCQVCFDNGWSFYWTHCETCNIYLCGEHPEEEEFCDCDASEEQPQRKS